MATISGDLKTKFTDDLGEPLVGGKVYTYHAGTSTPKDSYQDKEFAIVNSNPIILDDAGSCDLYLNGLYRLRVLDKDGVFVEERDYMTQGDSTGSSITDNANNITVLQSEVQAINERSVLKLDENNFVIGHGSANSATVHDPAFRLDKLKIAKKDDAESAKLLFNTYEGDTSVEGETVKEGSYINPDLITQPLVKNWRDVERAAFKGTEKDSKTNLLLKSGDTVPENSAASKLVGESAGNVMQVGAFGIGGIRPVFTATNLNTAKDGFIRLSGEHAGVIPNSGYPYNGLNVKDGTGGTVLVLPSASGGASAAKSMGYRFVTYAYTGTALVSAEIYTTANTTKDSNGFLKAASPVVDLYDDHIELNQDAEMQGSITYEKIGTGDYLVKGSLGFAQEGWYIEMPKDANGNVLVAVAYEQLENNDISIKTYDYMLNKKGRIVPDTETPLDIPEGRCINLRLHEEQLDETIE